MWGFASQNLLPNPIIKIPTQATTCSEFCEREPVIPDYDRGITTSVHIGAGIDQHAHLLRELAPPDGRILILIYFKIRVSAVLKQKADRISCIRPTSCVSQKDTMQESARMFVFFVVLTILSLFPIGEIKDGICVSVASREPVSQRVDIAPHSSHDYFLGRRAHCVITVSRLADLHRV